MADRTRELRRERRRRQERRFRALAKWELFKAHEQGAIQTKDYENAASTLDSPHVVQELMRQFGAVDSVFDWQEIELAIKEDWPYVLQTALAFAAEKNGEV